MGDWDLYFYPDTEVLRNKLGIQDAETLKEAERHYVELRIREGCPTGNFDLAHLQAIHRHLFQDVYEWAGELRTVSMTKAESGFMPPDRLEMGMHDVHRRIVKADFLRDTDPWEFAAKAAEIIGDINHAHPFREGNGRAQLQFLKQLGEQAGHNVDLTRLTREAWIEASIEANLSSYGAMNDQIRQTIVPSPEKARATGREGNFVEAPTTLPREEVAELRESLKVRQNKERRELLEAHRAERTEIARSGDGGKIEKMTERHAVEIFAQDKLHKEELPRYLREREEAQRMRERQEERRRAEELNLEKKSPERER